MRSRRSPPAPWPKKTPGSLGCRPRWRLNSIQDIIVRVRTNLNGRHLFDVKTKLLENAWLKRVDGVASVYEESTSMEATATGRAPTNWPRIYRELGQSEKPFPHAGTMPRDCQGAGVVKENSDPSRQNLANVYRDLAIVSEEFQRDMTASLSYNRESLTIWEDVYQESQEKTSSRLDRKIVRYFLAEANTRMRRQPLQSRGNRHGQGTSSGRRTTCGANSSRSYRKILG